MLRSRKSLALKIPDSSSNSVQMHVLYAITRITGMVVWRGLDKPQTPTPPPPPPDRLYHIIISRDREFGSIPHQKTLYVYLL